MDPHSEHSENLRSKFEDFEHTPADKVWRRIQIEMEGDMRPGALAGKLGEFAHAPRTQVWDRIAAEVQPMRKGAVIFWWAATAASVAVLLFVGWRFSGKKTGESTQPAATWSAVVPEDSSAGRDGSFSGSGQGSKASEGRNSFAGNRPIPRQLSLAEQGLSPLLFAAVDDLDEGEIPDESGTEPDQWYIPRRFLLAADTLPDSQQKDKYRFARKENIRPDNWDELPPLPDRDARIYSAALSSTLSPAGSASIFGIRSADGVSEQSGNPTLGFGSLTSNEDFGPVEGENFNTPFMVGLQLRRELGKRFSLGAGPVYTLMTSSWQRVEAGIETNDRIRRQYLGAAVSANYHFLKRRRISTYLTAGTRLDIGLDHRRRTTSVRDGETLADEVDTYSLGPQALANLGVGLDYHLGGPFGLYAQASVQHAFWRTDPNLWTVRRYWPGMQLGLRMGL